MKTAISHPNSSSLGLVEIETKEGDIYMFPAMDKKVLEEILPKEELSASAPTLAMVNASFSVLSIPFRIIKTVKVDGAAWWVCLA